MAVSAIFWTRAVVGGRRFGDWTSITRCPKNDEYPKHQFVTAVTSSEAESVAPYSHGRYGNTPSPPGFSVAAEAGRPQPPATMIRGLPAIPTCCTSARRSSGHSMHCPATSSGEANESHLLRGSERKPPPQGKRTKGSHRWPWAAPMWSKWSSTAWSMTCAF